MNLFKFVFIHFLFLQATTILAQVVKGTLYDKQDLKPIYYTFL